MGSYVAGGLYSERIFPWLMDHADTEDVREERRRVLSDAGGRVLEVGVGTGANFRHYPPGALSVTAVEPSGGMNRRAARHRAEARVPVRLVAGSAEALPFQDAVFDTAVAIFVLCTIPDPARALQEIRRVLVPDGRLIFLEHVRATDPGVERWQRRLQPVWGRVACGCVLARDTERRIVEAGFKIGVLDRFWLPKAPRVLGRMIRGKAMPA